jgi:hypothetical protein
MGINRGRYREGETVVHVLYSMDKERMLKLMAFVAVVVMVVVLEYWY